jgi:hypothetical protein
MFANDSPRDEQPGLVVNAPNHCYPMFVNDLPPAVILRHPKDLAVIFDIES